MLIQRETHELAKMNLLNLVPHEPSQRTEYKNNDDTGTKSVIDHIARLDFKISHEGGTLISFHHSYLDYLDDVNMIDPAEARQK